MYVLKLDHSKSLRFKIGQKLFRVLSTLAPVPLGMPRYLFGRSLPTTPPPRLYSTMMGKAAEPGNSSCNPNRPPPAASQTAESAGEAFIGCRGRTRKTLHQTSSSDKTEKIFMMKEIKNGQKELSSQVCKLLHNQ